MMVDIELNNIDMSYRRGHSEVQIFSDLSLLIPANDFVAVMGPSGSGKTTLLNLIGGLSRPTAGSVSIGGHRIDQLSDRALTEWRGQSIGFVSQFYNLMPVLTAAENVELPLLLRNLPRARRRENVEKALALVGLEGRSRHRPWELSGGQQQRVAIARAIVSDPRLILADEPTGDLDRESAAEILSLLSALNEEMGKTIIMVTHDENAAAFAKRTLRVNKGTFTQRLDVAA